jgi:hypothetical protein
MINTYEEDKIANPDHVATPRWVVENIYNLIGIKSFKNIWFPFNNYDSQFKLYADELKLKYKATHIFDDLENDFFKTEPPIKCDLLISNPPFSQQNEIIKRTFKLVDEGKIKSFCLLLPLATLETPTRAEMYEKNFDKLSILIFKKRIHFLNTKGSFNKGCCWICYNIKNLNKKIYWI